MILWMVVSSRNVEGLWVEGAGGGAAAADVVARRGERVHVWAVDDVAEEGVQGEMGGMVQVGVVDPVTAQVQRLRLHEGQQGAAMIGEGRHGARLQGFHLEKHLARAGLDGPVGRVAPPGRSGGGLRGEQFADPGTGGHEKLLK
jgi:hypothetical protein